MLQVYDSSKKRGEGASGRMALTNLHDFHISLLLGQSRISYAIAPI